MRHPTPHSRQLQSLLHYCTAPVRETLRASMHRGLCYPTAPSPAAAKAPPLPSSWANPGTLSRFVIPNQLRCIPTSSKSQCTSPQDRHLSPPLLGMESTGRWQLSQPSPTRPVGSQTLEMLCIASSLHHRRLLALTACLGLGTHSIAALQCFEISSDFMDLSNLCLLFNRPHCWG